MSLCVLFMLLSIKTINMAYLQVYPIQMICNAFVNISSVELYDCHLSSVY